MSAAPDEGRPDDRRPLRPARSPSTLAARPRRHDPRASPEPPERATSSAEAEPSLELLERVLAGIQAL